jgi:translation initiation factor 5B
MEIKTGIRQPIVTIAGHVDHGKTSILDALRESSVAELEAGNITQKISFSLFPLENLKRICPLIEKNNINVEIPGFLFIDTPGHAAFNSLRKRGGSLADIAILVVDINEGIKPQTAEVIQILKANKTPFVIAMNKIDKIKGWNILPSGLKDSIEHQPEHAKREFEEKYYTFLGALNDHNIEADLYFNITDFTKKFAIIPCSASTKQGIPELIMVLCGLSQKFLRERLKLGEKARGVILELKKESSINYLEAILYDGNLKVNDKIFIASFGKPIEAKIKSIMEIMPVSDKFKPVNSVHAASGIRIQISEKEEILAGMPFSVCDSLEDFEKEFKKEISEKIRTDKTGIVIKADSLGSLEAMINLLKEHNINIVRAGIGTINKFDLSTAKANIQINPIDAVILGFNVDVAEDIKKDDDVKIFNEEVVYKLIEKFDEFRIAKSKEIERERLMELSVISKLQILHQYVFRNTNPAIFGVRIEAGKLIPDAEIIDDEGESIGRIKNIQLEGKSVREATSGMEVAVSVSGVNFERKLKSKEVLFSNISEKQFKKFKDNRDLLSSDEISVLQEIAQIKRKFRDSWGI